VDQPGFRVRQFVVATTLLDAEKYSAADVAELYHHRWHVELDIRAIKQTLQMDISGRPS
jgi:IS4 transposase